MVAWQVGVLAAVLFLLTGLVLYLLLRQVALSAAAEQHNQQLRTQLGDSTRLLTELGKELAASRSDARAEAERARASLAERMLALGGTVGEQLGAHNKVMLEVKGQLGGLQEAAKNMVALGADINSLQDILRAPKLRGNLGELFLEEILRQVLPTSAFAMQHRLPGDAAGTYVTVDAVIRLNDRLVPIDSKFPLESFQRVLEATADEAERAKRRKEFLEVVRKHIDVIADKYIRPDAGTYDFALAYLPAENVYYEAIVRDDAVDGCRSVVAHAAARKVIPVSPNTLYAYLLTIAYGLKGMRIERQAEALRAQLAGFNKKFVTFYQVFEKVGRNLDLAQRGYDDAQKRAGKLNEQVGKMTGAMVELDEAASAAEDGSGALSMAPELALFPAESGN